MTREDSGCTPIHGSAVFKNCMINQFGKVKFIAMRGKLGHKMSIFGDPLYDWGKIFQSLVGYDEIYYGPKSLSTAYKNKLIEVFEHWIVTTYDTEVLYQVKMIAASMLFTLVPLEHKRGTQPPEKLTMYIELARKIIADARNRVATSKPSTS